MQENKNAETENNSKNINRAEKIDTNQFATADTLIVDIDSISYEEQDLTDSNMKILFVENNNEKKGKNLIVIVIFNNYRI